MTLAFTETAMGELDWKVIVPAVSAAIALVSLAAVLYKEFFQGARLGTVIDRVGLLRVPPISRHEITVEILIDDLLSDPRSEQANNLLRTVPALQDAVGTRDRKQIAAALDAHSRINQIIYDPAPPAVARYSADRRFVTNFYVPLIIANSGRKTGHLSSVVFVAREKANHSRKWAFVPFVVLEPKNLMPRPGEIKDTDRIAGLFIGVSVPPQSSIDVHPWFVPLQDADNRIISRNNMSTGEYEVRMYGYGPKGKLLFRTQWSLFRINENQLFEAFRGTDAVENLTIEYHVADAISREG